MTQLTPEEIAKIEEEERVRAEARANYSRSQSIFPKKSRGNFLKNFFAVWGFFIAIIAILCISANKDLPLSQDVFPLIMLAIGSLIYFIPTIIAGGRKKRNSGAIFVLNLLLGWTFIGWVVSLIWALTND